MEMPTSRQNSFIRRLRRLAADGDYRRECGEFLCDGEKLFNEALLNGARITSVLWRETPGIGAPEGEAQYLAPAGLFEYASPMKNSPGPLFTVAVPEISAGELQNAIILEGVQDPGNVGTVIRSAAAFGIDAVILTGACAELYSPKTVRATMGAIFRQRVIQIDDAPAFCRDRGLRLCGAALSERAADIRTVSLKKAAVAVGSEGRGLSEELLAACEGEIIIPMDERSESLNAAVAAAIIMWEMAR